jgi:hypothetical protein
VSNVPFINQKNRKKDKEYPKIMKNFVNLANIVKKNGDKYS